MITERTQPALDAGEVRLGAEESLRGLGELCRLAAGFYRADWAELVRQAREPLLKLRRLAEAAEREGRGL